MSKRYKRFETPADIDLPNPKRWPRKPTFTKEQAEAAFLGKIITSHFRYHAQKIVTGPYIVVGVHAPCCCPSYMDSINAKRWTDHNNPDFPNRREWHVHLICRDAGQPKLGRKGNESYIADLRLDGTGIEDKKGSFICWHEAVDLELLPDEPDGYRAKMSKEERAAQEREDYLRAMGRWKEPRAPRKKAKKKKTKPGKISHPSKK